MRGDAGRPLPALPARRARREVHAEDSAGLERGGEPELAAEVRRAAGDYERAADELRAARPRPRSARFARPRRGVELWTSSATHAVLPLLATDAGLRPPAGHRHRLAPSAASAAGAAGFWLPECAYAPGARARRSAEHGVRRFCVDQTAAHGLGAPEQLEPVRARLGRRGRAVDWQTVELVWNERDGLSRPPRPTATTTAARSTTCARGQRAARPTTATAALELAREHARDFVRPRSRVDAYAASAGGLACCCALDTELLGHWWYEGPAWLAAVLEEAGERGARAGHACRTALERAPAGGARARARPPGARTRTSRTWDSPRVAELAFGARRAELRTVARRRARRRGRGAALERAARELLALQSSDWAFMTTRELAADYPLRAHGRAPRRSTTPRSAALTDSAPVPEPALRSLAPDLDLAPLDRAVADARPDPVLGVPAADRGRPGAPRAQARREPRRRRTWTCTCSRAGARSRRPRRRWTA